MDVLSTSSSLDEFLFLWTLTLAKMMESRVTRLLKSLLRLLHVELCPILQKLRSIMPGENSIYKPLPSAHSTRVLELQPGSGTDPIVCSLIVVPDYNYPPDYTALSYCWGSATNTTNITCDGRDFPITWNLQNALRRLRSKSKTRIVWADAICINQADTAERRQQVTIMVNIYRQARHTCIWLGDIDGDAVLAMDLIRDLAHGVYTGLYMPEDPNHWLETIQKQSYQSGTVQRSTKARPVSSSDRRWPSFERFFQRPWFKRVWVIQEALNSSKSSILCGPQQMEWNLVVAAAMLVFLSQDSDHAVVPKLRHTTSLHGVKLMAGLLRLFDEDESQFLRALDSTTRFEATDPRDKVFALLQYQMQQEEFTVLSKEDNVSGLNLVYH